MYYCWKKDKSIRPSVFWNQSEADWLVIDAFARQEIEDEKNSHINVL